MSEENPVPGTHKRSSTLVQQVMDSLSRRIEQGEYSPGDKLPPESGLMLEQHVSRTVIREAISRLQAAGLVETRHGIGTFVLSPPTPRPRLDFSTVATIDNVLTMLEFRISMETEAAGLAALRRSEAQLGAMREALEHKKILEAIARQDQKSARQAMYKHLANGRERLQQVSKANETQDKD